jgi:hypothetical protein
MREREVAFLKDLMTRAKRPTAQVMHVSDWAAAYARRYVEGQDRRELVSGTLIRCPVCASLVGPVDGSHELGHREHPECIVPVGAEDITFPGGVQFRCPECRGVSETFLKG